MPDLLDAAYPPADPAVLVADVRAAGARAVGLYAVNLSVPAAVREPAYALAVKALGVGVLPIVVPGNVPPLVPTVIAALTTWGLGLNDLIVVDIERWSTPPVAWVAEFCRAWSAAGIYCQEGYRAQYAAAQPRFWWLAAWSTPPPVPPTWDAHQYGSYQGPSGMTYDASTVLPTIRFWGQQEDTDMPNRSYFELEAGDEVWVPGANAQTNWNAAAQAADAELTIGSYALDGTPVAGGFLPQIVAGNDPNVKGPVQVFGQGIGLTGPGTFYFKNGGPGRLVVGVGW